MSESTRNYAWLYQFRFLMSEIKNLLYNAEADLKEPLGDIYNRIRY